MLFRSNKHEGVISEKFIYTEKPGQKDSVRGIHLYLTNGQEFVVSRYADALNNLLLIGDSVQLYTKPVKTILGNQITNGNGRTWNTRNDREVFHLLSNRYEGPLVDFEENRRELIKTAWLFPFCSLCFLGWYLYRRSGKKSPLIREWGGWTGS